MDIRNAAQGALALLVGLLTFGPHTSSPLASPVGPQQPRALGPAASPDARCRADDGGRVGQP